MSKPNFLRSTRPWAEPEGYKEALWSTHILHVDDGMVMAEVGPVCVIIWRQGMTNIRVARLRDGLQNFLTRYASGAAVLCVVEQGAKPPEDGARRELSRMIASQKGVKLLCMAHVIEGTGFRIALARSVILAIAHLIARKENMSCFQSLELAVLWMSNYLSGMPRERVLESVERLRSSMDPPFAP